MITVEWMDFNAPRGPDHKVAVRRGRLLQVGMARMPREADSVNVAFVITDWIDSDHGAKPDAGEKVILPVRLTDIRVKGTVIPLFDGGGL